MLGRHVEADAQEAARAHRGVGPHDRGASVNPVKPQWIDLGQRPKLAVRVPPAMRELAELLKLGRIDIHAHAGHCPKKKPRRSGARLLRPDAYFVLAEPELLDDDPALPGLRFCGPLTLELDEPALPLELVLPLVAPAPAGAGAEPAVVSRLPRSSASTRRSGCRQAMSFWFLLFSGPMFLHCSPVTD